eukprot:Sspe_Gene.40725::Locus_19677_Transcript_1_1_Confidence_1.000_Length_655::g.40725::m.40725
MQYAVYVFVEIMGGGESIPFPCSLSHSLPTRNSLLILLKKRERKEKGGWGEGGTSSPPLSPITLLLTLLYPPPLYHPLSALSTLVCVHTVPVPVMLPTALCVSALRLPGISLQGQHSQPACTSFSPPSPLPSKAV